ncbi:MAG: PAS domain S-box protein [Nitrospira sp.]|nr:PAS domain S-box protein [Nitrospira sp.]
MNAQWTERRLTLAGLGLGLIVLVGLLAYATNRGAEQGSQREAFREIRTVVEHILALESHLSDAESGQRGFLLTHDATYLAPYHIAIEQIPGILSKLEQEAKQDNVQREQVEALRLLTERKLAGLRMSLDMAQTSHTDAIDFVRDNAGKQQMDDLKRQLKAVRDREYEILQTVDRHERQAADETFRTIIWGSGLALLLVAIVTYRMIRDTGARELADRLTAQSQLLNLAPIMTRDIDGRILSWSKGYERLYGWTEDEAIGKISHDLLRTQFSTPLDEIQRTLSSDGNWSGELTHTRHDGKAISVAANWTLLKEGRRRPTAVVEVNTDISDLKTAQEAQAQSEARFRLLADHMSQFAWITDEKGWIHWYNNRWFEYTGTTLSEMQGWGWKKVHHPDHVDRVVEKITRCFETGEVWEDTFPLRGRDGQYRWFLSRAIPIRDTEGRILQWFGTNTDITEQHQAEQALAEQMIFTRSILDSLAVHIAVIDVRGVILQVNKAWTNFSKENLGACPPELVGAGINYLDAARAAASSDTEVRQTIEGIEAVLAGTLGVFEQEYSCHTPSQPRWFRMTVSPLRTSEGGAVITHLDITARKLAEEAKGFLAAIVTSSPDAIITKSLEGLILTWNRGAEGLFGYANDEIVGRRVDTLVPEELREEEQTLRKRTLSGTSVEQFETQRLHKSGRRLDVSISMSPIKDEVGSIVATAQTMRDITYRKQAELSLQASERFKNALFQSSPDCVKVFDPAGCLLEMNSQGLCAMEIEEFERIKGKHWTDLWPADSRDTIQQTLDSCRKGEPSSFRGFCPTAQGTPRWWDVAVSPVHDGSGRILAVSRDITVQEHFQTILRQSEERFRTLTTNIPQLVWSCLPDGACNYLSEQWLSYTGTTLDENLGYGWLSLIHPDDAPAVDRTWKQSVASGSPFMTEYRLKAADGSYYWQLARATAQRNDKGDIHVWFGTTTNISDQKEVESTLERFNTLLESKSEALAAANKELEAFSYSVSHDLRAPLRTMTGFAQALLEDYGEKLEPEAARYLKIISNGAGQMGRLIDDLLSFSRLSRQNLSVNSISLSELVQEIRDELAADQAGRTIEWDIAELPTCRGDRSTIKLVLANLIGNALKYTRPRDVAKIQVGRKVDEQQPRRCQVFVKDNGVGFDMQYADKLFTVFQRLHRAEEFEGTGIGLAIVQRIVHRHGGRVWADARPNEGATFWFTLEQSSC